MTTHLERMRQHRARQEVLRVWRFLREHYARLADMPPPDLIMTAETGGNLALAEMNNRVIEVNIDYFNLNFDVFMDEVLAHECAHIAAWDLHYHEGHGKPWRRIMKRLGLKARVRYQVVFPPAKAGRDNPAVSGI